MLPPIASRFVAGESPADALEHAREVNERDVSVILNRLGEHYDERGPAEDDAAAYRDLVEELANTDVDACISIKPSQLGLDVGDDTFRELVTDLVDHAADRDVFVWIDMEDHPTTDVTLDVFCDLARKHDGGVGLCVQANLKRTREDIERLADVPGKVRFVKGAYDEPASIAYKDKARVDEAYRELLEYAFEHFDGGIAVGSHDPEMIDLAKRLHDEYGTDFEIQMLMGVRTDAQFDLAAEGYDVWQYAPYGGKWLSYFWRRVRERKENLLFALRAVVGR
ncbi:proline dehydrogenase [Halovivax asiaticus JCM 14624]|uniref:proline dehydrogenase n=1 Tax=Halovivax asiaticus JCM 14624 TaxID=1227490 RepID=M0BF52_9EURY|nr:proline dehydrogenase family protein [Halovivax asiaticus]ELZ08289.1 proline dehydrogenase [Halovivax asiaticus JCM 14624]